MSEHVNHPSHYNTGKIEVIDFIEDQKLDFHLGNAVKYVCRAGKKDASKELEDYRKAIWYIERKIKLMEAEAASDKPLENRKSSKAFCVFIQRVRSGMMMELRSLRRKAKMSDVHAFEVVKQFTDGVKTTVWVVVDNGTVNEIADDCVREAVIEYYEKYLKDEECVAELEEAEEYFNINGKTYCLKQTNVIDKEQRPPLGLKPRFVADEQRMEEITEAIQRYKDAGYQIPSEWIAEYKEIAKRIKVEVPKWIDTL